MGASGSAWIKPKKRRGLRTEALERVPHPRFVRPGQRFFPLASRGAAPVTVRVARVADGTCEARRETEPPATVRLSEQRLLATDADGAGKFYRFVGYASRTGYPTHACVVEAGTTWARIVCPEWHPELTITAAAGELPPEHAVGTWFACRADLGADAPARVRPHGFAPVAPGFDASRYPAVAFAQRAPERAESGSDAVLFISGGVLYEARTGPGVYVTGHPPPLLRGARAYLHAYGRVLGWRAVARVAPRPSGTYVHLTGPWHPVRLAGPSPALQASAAREGAYGRVLWAPKTWSSSDERAERPQLADDEAFASALHHQPDSDN